MVFDTITRKISVALKRAKAYSTYQRFDTLEDLVKISNQGKTLVEEDGKFYVVNGDKKELAVIPAHYECSGCGVIKSEPGERVVSSDLLPAKTKYGFEQYCVLCEEIIGHRYVSE